MFTVLVCGGRDYDDSEKVYNTLRDLCDKKGLWKNEHAPDLRVVTGGASGADTLAQYWAISYAGEKKVYYPDYDKYPPYAAPVIRNQQMLDEENVDLVIAFKGGPGTRDMTSRACKSRIPVQEVT